MRSDEAGWSGCLVLIALAVLMGVTMSSCSSTNQRKTNAAIMQKIPDYQTRALELFEKLDTDNDGLLHEEELRNHHLEGKLQGKDAEVVAFLYGHCRTIGHAVGSYRSGKYTYSVYAISRVDLKRLPETA